MFGVYMLLCSLLCVQYVCFRVFVFFDLFGIPGVFWCFLSSILTCLCVCVCVFFLFCFVLFSNLCLFFLMFIFFFVSQFFISCFENVFLDFVRHVFFVCFCLFFFSFFVRLLFFLNGSFLSLLSHADARFNTKRREYAQPRALTTIKIVEAFASVLPHVDFPDPTGLSRHPQELCPCCSTDVSTNLLT